MVNTSRMHVLEKRTDGEERLLFCNHGKTDLVFVNHGVGRGGCTGCGLGLPTQHYVNVWGPVAVPYLCCIPGMATG